MGSSASGTDASNDVLDAYADWARAVPDEMASSLLLLRYPDDMDVPAELRGRHITHLRVTYSGDDQREGRHLIDTMPRVAPPLSDSVRMMPYADVGSIHHEHVDVPVAAFDRNALLADFDHDAAAMLSKLAGPDAGAAVPRRAARLGRRPQPPAGVPNAIAWRDAAFSLLAIADADGESRAARDELLDAMDPWSTGMTYTNFCGVEDTAVESVQRCYRPADFNRLRRIKAAVDPANTFRVNFNIPPETSPR